MTQHLSFPGLALPAALCCFSVLGLLLKFITFDTRVLCSLVVGWTISDLPCISSTPGTTTGCGRGSSGEQAAVNRPRQVGVPMPAPVRAGSTVAGALAGWREVCTLCALQCHGGTNVTLPATVVSLFVCTLHWTCWLHS